jgi:hypothetical protein
MTTGEPLQEQLKTAGHLGERLEQVVIDKKQVPSGERNALLLGYWALAFDFHKGILSLLQTKYFGSAFALVRPLVESMLRAHLVLMGDDKELARLQEDDYRIDFKAIALRIDSVFGLEGLMQKFLNDNARDGLHSYTHSGALQIGRRFDGYDLIPNYGDDEIVEVIRLATSVIFMVTILVTRSFGFEEDWRNVTNMYVQWGKP